MSDTTWISDQAFSAFEKWLSTAPKEQANEDTTRLRIIDVILFDILGWDRNKALTERYVEKVGYADYSLVIDQVCRVVVEAKKGDITFVLPASYSYPSESVPFSQIAKQCPDALQAMQQAASYANSLGAKYTVITNGRQWIIMLTSMEGTVLQDRPVMVFESLDAIHKRFSSFFECLGPLNIRVNTPYSKLSDARKQPAPSKLSKSIVGYPVVREESTVRNQHSTGIQYIWDEVNSSDTTVEFFQRCYVPPLGHDKNKDLAAQLLSDRFDEDSARTERLAAADVAEFLKEPPRPEKPVLLLGRIGRGKTTFIRFLKEIAAKSTLSNYVQIDVNFLDCAVPASGVSKYVYDTVKYQLNDRYRINVMTDAVVRGALNIQLREFSKEPRPKHYLETKNADAFKEAELTFIDKMTADDHEYLKLVVRHIRRGHKKSFAIFFDNLDKRDDLQEAAFLAASGIAREWEAIVFVCLRPGTYQASRDSGVLDSIAPRRIEIHAPQIKLFLKRRLDYCAAIASGACPPPREHSMLSKAVATQGKELAGLFSAFSNSLQHSAPLVNLFDAVANGNLREILDRVGAVMSSWHLNTGEICEAIRTQGDYLIAHHQAFRAMILGNSEYFDAVRSPFVNLFDLRHADPIEHFLRPVCLHYLLGSQNEQATKGFRSLGEIESAVGASGYTLDLISDTVRFLFAKRLIEDDNFSESWDDAQQRCRSNRQSIRLRLTGLGKYHVADLITKFQYLDIVVMDTPIIDKSVLASLHVVNGIEDRLARARTFLRYLNTCAHALPSSSFNSHWTACHTALANQITDIENKIGKGASERDITL